MLSFFVSMLIWLTLQTSTFSWRISWVSLAAEFFNSWALWAIVLAEVWSYKKSDRSRKSAYHQLRRVVGVDCCSPVKAVRQWSVGRECTWVLTLVAHGIQLAAALIWSLKTGSNAYGWSDLTRTIWLQFCSNHKTSAVWLAVSCGLCMSWQPTHWVTEWPIYPRPGTAGCQKTHSAQNFLLNGVACILTETWATIYSPYERNKLLRDEAFQQLGQHW
jgi:hypothetical protein